MSLILQLSLIKIKLLSLFIISSGKSLLDLTNGSLMSLQRCLTLMSLMDIIGLLLLVMFAEIEVLNKFRLSTQAWKKTPLMATAVTTS